MFITGCSSGIGLTSAYYLRDQLNFRVIASARKKEDKTALEDAGFEAVLLDLDDSTSIKEASLEVISLTNNKLYALFNNAGYGVYGALTEVSRTVFEEQFSTNLFGLHELTMQLLPAMLPHGEGRIIQTSSVLGFVTMPRRGVYCASKYALEAWSDALRMELFDTGLQVSIIEPGSLNTAFSQNILQTNENNPVVNSPSAEKFTLTAMDVMPKLKHALLSKRAKSRYRVTMLSHLMWYLKKWLPTTWLDVMLRKN